MFNRPLLGEILIELGHITPKEVDTALLLQRGKETSFGDALVELGSATRKQVNQALRLQGKLEGKIKSRPAPKKVSGAKPSLGRLNDMLLGEILVRQGHIEREDVQEAIKLQRKTGMRIGG